MVLYNFIGRNIADPTNYRFLQEAAGDVLSREKAKHEKAISRFDYRPPGRRDTSQTIGLPWGSDY